MALRAERFAFGGDLSRGVWLFFLVKLCVPFEKLCVVLDGFGAGGTGEPAEL